MRTMDEDGDDGGLDDGPIAGVGLHFVEGIQVRPRPNQQDFEPGRVVGLRFGADQRPVVVQTEQMVSVRILAIVENRRVL